MKNAWWRKFPDFCILFLYSDEYNSIDRIVRNATDNIRYHNDTFREWTSLTLGTLIIA